MTANITPRQVQTFVIDSQCNHMHPCRHDVKLTLKDGIRAHSWLEGDQIFVLIKNLPRTKIAGDTNHFRKFRTYTGMSEKHSYIRPLPKDVLAKIFKNEIKAKNIPDVERDEFGEVQEIFDLKPSKKKH
jgi:hypothetical protein